MDDQVTMAIFGAAVPMGIALLTVARSGRPAVASDAESELPLPRDFAAFRFPLLFAGVVLLAFLGTLQTWRGEDWQEVLLWLSVTSGCLGVAMSLLPRGVLRTVGFALLAAGCAWWVLRFTLREGDPWLCRVLPPAGAFLLVVALEPLAERRAGPTLPLTVGAAVGSAALIVVLSGDVSVGVPFGAAGAALLVFAIFSVFSRRLTLADGALATLAVILVTLPTMRWVYIAAVEGEAPILPFVLPCIAPLCAWIAEIGPLRRRGAWLRVPAAAIPAFVICGAAVFLILTGSGGADDDAGDPYADYYEQMMTQ